MKTKNAYALLFLIILSALQIDTIEREYPYSIEKYLSKEFGTKTYFANYTKFNYYYSIGATLEDVGYYEQPDLVFQFNTFRSEGEPVYQVSTKYASQSFDGNTFRPQLKRIFITCFTDLPPPLVYKYTSALV